LNSEDKDDGGEKNGEEWDTTHDNLQSRAQCQHPNDDPVTKVKGPHSIMGLFDRSLIVFANW
jgi:hypothetical protein